MNTQPDRDETRIVAERAAAWRSAVATGEPQQLAAFWAWVKESPSHVREAMVMGVLDDALKHLDPERRIDVQHLIDADARKVIPFSRPPPAATFVKPFSRQRRVWAMAACGVLAASVVAWRWVPVSWLG